MSFFYSSYLGGSNFDSPRGVAVSSGGRSNVTGRPNPSGLPDSEPISGNLWRRLQCRGMGRCICRKVGLSQSFCDGWCNFDSDTKGDISVWRPGFGCLVLTFQQVSRQLHGFFQWVAWAIW